MPLSKFPKVSFFFNMNAHMPLSRKIISLETEGRRCITLKMRGLLFSKVPEVPFFFKKSEYLWEVCA